MTACLYYAWWREGLNMLVTVVLFVVGFLTWGSIEYVLHRFIFHWQPGTKVCALYKQELFVISFSYRLEIGSISLRMEHIT